LHTASKICVYLRYVDDLALFHDDPFDSGGLAAVAIEQVGRPCGATSGLVRKF
jgi:hypothetical protein